MNARGAVVPTCMFPCQELSNMAVSAHLLPTPPLSVTRSYWSAPQLSVEIARCGPMGRETGMIKA